MDCRDDNRYRSVFFISAINESVNHPLVYIWKHDQRRIYIPYSVKIVANYYFLKAVDDGCVSLSLRTSSGMGISALTEACRDH